LPNLEILDLGGSKKLIECPNVSGSPNLKQVILRYCESMPEVDSSIFLLQKLEVLNVFECTSLKSLSSNTCSPALRKLEARDCINLKEFSVTFSSVDGLDLCLSEWDGKELPSSILHKQNLKRFVFPISDCLVDLPENFADHISLSSPQNHEDDPFITLDKLFSSPAFQSVKELTFIYIPILSEFPDSISLLSSLKSLTLDGMDIRSLPETIKYLPRLERVDVYDCKMLQSIPALSQFIPVLVVSNCESLEEVLSSTIEPYEEPNPSFIYLLNCKKLEPHSYQIVLKDAMDRIETGPSLYDDDEIIWYFLPAMPGMENWFHYSSTQVSVTLELPSNLQGFSYYLVLSQGHMGYDVDFGCECYLDKSSADRIYIRSFTRANFFSWLSRFDPSIHMMSDHLVFWYDQASCKQIMAAVEEIKSISDVNSTSYNPKLTFRFFIEEDLYDEVAIKECGFHWIYNEEIIPSTISESHDQEETASSSNFQSNHQEEIVSPNFFESDDQEETIPPRNKLQLDIVGTMPSNFELDETYDMRYIIFLALIILITWGINLVYRLCSILWYCKIILFMSRSLLEELMHIGFGGEHMNTLLDSTEGKSNSSKGEKKMWN